MKKVCFVTGTRAEYGLLSPLMKLVRDCVDFDLQIIVTGMHLSPEFGCTYKSIEDDGFCINEKVEILLSSDTSSSMVKSTGLGFLSFPDAFARLSPDIVVVLGDRYEIFAATASAYFMKIPIAHLHGGETTEGAVDEGIRHAITKMSYLHFASTELYRRRVIQLGEDPTRVYNVGAIGIDNITNLSLMNRNELADSLVVNLDQPFFLITYHPVTLSSRSEEDQMNELFAALDEFPHISTLFTLPNSDAGGRKIISCIQEYVSKRSNSYAFTSLGQIRYLSAVKEAVAVIGNSSSGIIEVPSLKTATVNIGIRQKGRIAASSVIHCSETKDEITAAITTALAEDFAQAVANCKNPYGHGDCAEKIFTIIHNEINKIKIQKPFYDVEFTL